MILFVVFTLWLLFICFLCQLSVFLSLLYIFCWKWKPETETGIVFVVYLVTLLNVNHTYGTSPPSFYPVIRIHTCFMSQNRQQPRLVSKWCDWKKWETSLPHLFCQYKMWAINCFNKNCSGTLKVSDNFAQNVNELQPDALIFACYAFMN